MKKNMGLTDMRIRLIVALIIAVLFFTNIITGVLGILLLVLAGIFTVTSFIQFCPIYKALGIKTCHKKEINKC